VILLDTDTFSLLARGDASIAARAEAAADTIALTVLTRIEVLRARFDFVLKAADGAQLLRAQSWLARTEHDLASLPIVWIDDAAAAEFDRLRREKALKKIGRTDLLIASIALAQGATLVTRNVRHFGQVPRLHVENWTD